MRKSAAFLPFVITVVFLHGFAAGVRGYDYTVADGQTFTSSADISLADGDNTITVGTNGTADYSGIFSDPNATAHGRLVKAGPGLLILSGANTYTGGTLLQGGTIRLDSGLSLNSWAAGGNQGTLTVTGEGTIQTSSNRSISNRFLTGDNNASLMFDIAGGTTLTISNVVPQSTSTASSSIYGGAISTGILASRPIFTGGGNLVLRDNSAGSGGALAGNAVSGNAGFDLTELASLLIDGNKALGGSGGAISVSATEKTGTSTLRLGDNITISNNSASTTSTGGDGGAIYITSSNNVLVETGNHATFSGNTAKRFGGAIYAFTSGAGFSADVVLGTNTFFEGNVSQAAAAALMGGGAVYSTHNLDVQGNTLFKDNSAAAPGGAILMYGREAGTLTLDTTNGDIAFTGNQGGGIANSIYLLQKTAVQVKGTQNVFFDDPLGSYDLAGNTVGIGRAFGSTNASDNFTGIAQFKGTSQFLNNTSFEAADGRTRLGGGTNVNSAQILGKTGSFTLGSNARLEGTGTIGFAANVLSGTLAPDSAVFTANTWNDSNNAFVAGTGKTTIESAETIGTLVFTGATKFDGATILVDISGTNYDKIVVNNTVTFGTTNNNVITITDAAVNGKYDIITSTTAAVGSDPSQYFTVSGNISGSTSFGRYGAKVQYGTASGIANSVVQVVIGGSVQNTVLTWTGNESTTWNQNADEDWTDNPGGTATVMQFEDGDRVLFDTVTTRNNAYTVNLAGNMIVADMSVSGSGNYIIQGASITGTVDPTKTTITDATGLLTKSGTGTLTLNNPNTFIGTVINGGTVVANDLGALGNAVTLDDTAGENATLQFNTDMNGTFGQQISGTGTLVKTGTGTLILAGANDSFTGGTTLVKEGQLWENIADNTALTIAAGARYNSTTASRNVSSLNGAGTVDMDGNRLTVNGGGDFSAGTLAQIGTLEKNGADMLTIGDVASGDLGTLTVNGGTLKIDTGKQVVVTGGTTVAAGTTLNIGALPALTTGSMNISDTGTILDICGCSANGIVVKSTNDIVGEFATHLVGGVAVTGDVSIDQFVNELTVKYLTIANDGQAGIEVGNGGLVWNNDMMITPNEAHGTFNIATSFKVIQTLADRTADDYVPVENWNGTTLTKTGEGVLTLENAANSYSGGTLINRGTLISQAAGSTGSGAVNVASGAGFVLDFGGAFANELTGTGSLTIANSTQNPANVVTIARDNSGFTGTTTINEGAALTMQNQNAVGNPMTSAIVVDGTLTLDYAPAVPNQAFGNSLSGGGNLATMGYYYILGANENFSGTTRVRTGDLQILNSAALGTSSVTVDAGAILELSVFSGTFANALDGAGDLNIRQNSDVVIARDNSGFMGMTIINSDSSLTLQHINAVGNQATQEVRNLGTLVFDLPGTGSETFNPFITQNGSVVKNGAGTLTLANANTNATYYSGSTTVNAGTLITNLATNTQVTPCGTDLIVAADATYRTRTSDQWVANLSGAGTVDMSAYDGTGNKNLTVCSGDFSEGEITGVDTLTKTGPDNTTVLAVGNVEAANLDLEKGTLNIAPGKTVELSGNATIRDNTILGIGANTALTATEPGGTVMIGTGTTLNVTGYQSSMGTVVLIDAGLDIAADFSTYTVNGVDQTTTISLNNYRNVSPIVQRNRSDMTQIVISVGGLVWNNTAPGTAHGNFYVTGNATVDDNLANNTVPGAGFNGWNGTTLTKTGNGTLTLTGTNGYTGGTNIDGGKIIGTNAGAIGNGPINLNGTGTSVEYNVATDGTTGNAISGSGSFVKSGNGELVQTGSNTYTGGTTVNGGTLVSNLDYTPTACGTPLDVKAGATYRTYETDASISKLTGSGAVDMNAYDGSGNKNLTVCSGDFSDGNLINVVTLTKKNAETSFIVGQAYADDLVLAEGTLVIAEDRSVVLTGTAEITNGTTLGIGVGDGTNPSLTAAGIVTIGNGTTIDITGYNGGSGVKMLLIHSDTGIMGGDETTTIYTVGGQRVSDTISLTQFINGLLIEKGEGDTNLYITSGGLVWNNDGTSNDAHGNFYVATNANAQISDLLVDNENTDATVDGEFGWDGRTLTKTGDGTLTLSNGNNAYTGGTIIEAGKVVATNAGVLGSGTVSNNSELEYRIDDTVTATNGAISGTGSVLKTGSGSLTLTGENAYTGGTAVNSGTLISNLAAPTPALPCGTALYVADDATYSPYNTDQFVSNLTGSGTVDMNAGNGTGMKNLTVCEGDFSAGEITGVGTLTKISGGTLPTRLIVGTVNGKNLDLQSGWLEIAEGKTVALTGDALIGVSTGLKVTAVEDTPALTADGSVSIGTGTTLNVTGYNPSMGTVVLIDAGSDIVDDFGVYMLNGTDQSTVITLADYRNTSPLIQRDADDLSRIIVSTGELVWNNTAPGTAHGTFNVTTDDTITEILKDNTSGAGTRFNWDGKTLTKTGDGNLTLTGDNTYTGGTIIKDGTVTADNQNALGTGAVDIQTDGTLALDFDGTMNNTIQGGGGLEIDGNVNIVKSNGDFTGTTTVKSGTTTLQRADGLGTSAIALGDDTTLFFNTASDGTSGNMISGTGNLVKNGNGTLTLGGDNIYTGTTTIRGGTLVANLTPSSPALPCGAALTVNAGATYQAKDRQQDVSVLSGTGIVDMRDNDLTVCSGDFTGGTFANLNNVTKKSADTFRTGGFDADNFTLQGGTFILNPGHAVTLTGTADIQGGTILDIGARPAFDVAGEVTIAPTATLNITGYSGSGSVVLIRSGTDIADHFGTYTINGVKVGEQTSSLDTYYIVRGIERIDNEILITDSHLAWYDPNNDSAHGTYKIDSGTVTISDVLENVTDSTKWLRDENGDPLWDGVTLTKTGNGTLVLGNANIYHGNTVIKGGSVVATGENSLGDPGSSGIVELTDNNASLVLSYTADAIFNKMVTGGGTIQKTDDYELTVASDLKAMTGVFRQDAGTVIFQPVDYLFAGSYDQRGGTFEGVDGLTVAGGANFEAVVRPNGTLNVERYVFLDGADLYVNLYANQVDGAYSDRINSATLTIDESVLHVDDVGVSTSYAKGKTLTFTVLHTTDGIFGDFSDVVGINTSLFNVDYGITADGLDYTITLGLKNSKPFGDYGWNHNTGQVGDALDHGMDDPDLAPLITELLNRDDDGIREGIDQLRGSEIVADARTLALWSPWRAVFNRLDETGPDGVCAPCNPCDPCGSPARPDRNAWVEGYYRSGDVSTDGNARSYDSTRGGILFGIDTDLNSRTLGGLVFGYGNPRLQSRFGKVEADDCTVGLYLKRYVFEKAYMKGFLGYGWQDYDFRRYDFGGRYDADAKGDAMYASLELVRPIRRGRSLTLLPLVAIDYQKSWSESLTETGGAYNQSIERGELDQLLIRVGLNGRYRWNDRLELSSRLQYACQVGGDLYGTAQSTFAMAPNSRPMDLRGVDLGRDRLNVGIGGSWYPGRQKRAYVFGNYDFDCGVNDTAHTGQVGLATSW